MLAWRFVLFFAVLRGIVGEFWFDFDGKEGIGDLGETEKCLGGVREELKELVRVEKEGEEEKRAPKPFKKFVKVLKRAMNDAEDEGNGSLKKLKMTVDALMAKIDEAYVEGEKSLARIIVQRNDALTTRLRNILHSMALAQKWLLDLSTNIVELIARKSLSN